jgi:hypothetical protein
MECVYGFDIDFLCSRDNFAIRPESFRVNLIDQNTTNTTQTRTLGVNTTAGTSGTPPNLVAGYNYQANITATNFLNDGPTIGYNAILDGNDSNSNRFIGFDWAPPTSINDSNCNDTNDYPSQGSFSYDNGSGTFVVNAGNVGNYDLEVRDREWTKVDWEDNSTAHHTGIYYTTGDDCVMDDSVPALGVSTTISGNDLTNVSGCIIQSSHNKQNSQGYTDIPVLMHPFVFNTAGLTPFIGPQNRPAGQTYVYIDSPRAVDPFDFNMSYNIIGTYFAADFTGNQLSNFVNQCYAQNINMGLNLTYNHPAPTITPFLSYRLRDYNATNPNTYIRPTNASGDNYVVNTFTSTTGPLLIQQRTQDFVRDMRGAIRMNLGYNFMRANNLPLDPRFITMNSFDLRYTTPIANVNVNMDTNHQIESVMRLDQNVSFLYGKVKPSKDLYNDVTTTSILTQQSVSVYCSTLLGAQECQNRGIPILTSQTNEAEWWRSATHDSTRGDGRVSLQIGNITEGGVAPTVLPSAVNITLNGDNNDTNVSQGPNPVLPMTVEINLVTEPNAQFTNSWLIYDPTRDQNDTTFANSIPTPYYRVRFINPNALWTGVGATGNVLNTQSNTKRTKRMDW